jgi:hypothetical protein
MKDAAKVVTEITFYFSALQNINLLFFIMFVSWQIPIACLQNFRARFRKMYTEWLLLTAEWCIFSYILLHIKCLITRIRLQSADHKKHEIQISHVFCIFPYFSEIFRNFPGNFPEIFRNIIFRKIYITSCSGNAGRRPGLCRSGYLGRRRRSSLLEECRTKAGIASLGVCRP